MELKTLVCPNCGANTTNTQNCEYCGSLFVRFVDKGIDIRNTSYLSDTYSFPYLLPELKKNLALQEANPDFVVMTDICWIDEKGKDHYICVASGLCWLDESPIMGFGEVGGLKISFGFDIYQNNHDYELNKMEDEKLSRFESLPSFPLFAYHSSTYDHVLHGNTICREYAINFGKDAEGATKLVSEILTQIYGLKPTDEYVIFTNQGTDDIFQARHEWNVAHGLGHGPSDLEVARKGGLILAVVSVLVLFHWVFCSDSFVMVLFIIILGYNLTQLWFNYRDRVLSRSLKVLWIMVFTIILGYIIFFIL